MPNEQVVIENDSWEAAALAIVEELTPRERVFVIEYLNCWNPRTAAARAGYSAKSARAYGYQLLKRPDIAEAIGRFTDARIASAAMNIDLLVEQATGDMSDFFSKVTRRDRHGKEYEIAVLDLGKALDMGKGRLIKKVKVNSRTGEPIELELYSAQDAIALLMRALGQFKDKVDVSVDWRQEVAQTGANPDEVRDQLKAMVRGLLMAPKTAEPSE